MRLDTQERIRVGDHPLRQILHDERHRMDELVLRRRCKRPFEFTLGIANRGANRFYIHPARIPVSEERIKKVLHLGGIFTAGFLADEAALVLHILVPLAAEVKEAFQE